MASQNVSKKRKFVADGVFFAELNELFTREVAEAEALKFKLLGGLAVRRACYGVIRNVMESGAQGVEVIVSGKLRGQRAKAMIFNDGYMIKAGNPCRDYIDKATRHVLLRQGCVGIKIEIMLPHDPQGKAGPKKPMPDFVEVFEPKDDVVVAAAPQKGEEQ